MNLRQKTLLLTTLPLLGLMVLLYGSLSAILNRSYARLEQQDAQRNLQRVEEVMAGDLIQMQQVTEDWAAWDDTHTFVQDGNPAYIESNLHKYAFESLRLNVVMVVDTEGTLVYGKGYDFDHRAFLPVPPSLAQQVATGSPLLKFPHLAYHYQGIVSVDDQLMLVVVEPILRSDATGPPQGAFVMGRYLDADMIESLSLRTRLDLQVHPLKAGFPGSLQPIVNQLTAQAPSRPTNPSHPTQAQPIPTVVQPQQANALAAYALWPDIYGQPQMMLELNLPRDIYQQGLLSRRYLGLALLGACVVSTAGILLLLDRVILRRLLKLSQQVQQIGRSNDLAQRVTVQGHDELGHLGKQINDMLGELQISNQKLAEEQQKAENLLLNILPETIAGELMQTNVSAPQHFDEVTILFADIVGFTSLSSRLSPIKLVDMLNQIFSAFDGLAEQLGLEKIKTIGDAYMVAAGLPTPRTDHAEAIAEMALAMQQVTTSFRAESGEPLAIRIGINTGVAVAGVIGTKKFIYDLWGDAVNVASRMESLGEPGMIQVTAATYARLKDHYILEKRGSIAVKGRGDMETYWLRGHRPDSLFCRLSSPGESNAPDSLSISSVAITAQPRPPVSVQSNPLGRSQA